MKLRALRERRFLSQRDLEELSGVSHVTISRIEQGYRKPWPRTARKLAAALGVQPEELVKVEGTDA